VLFKNYNPLKLKKQPAEAANKPAQEVAGIKNFVKDAEKAPQPKIEEAKPTRYSRLMKMLRR
jgi:hypothetical protein